jgi:hypothetical protein
MRTVSFLARLHRFENLRPGGPLLIIGYSPRSVKFLGRPPAWCPVFIAVVKDLPPRERLHVLRETLTAWAIEEWRRRKKLYARQGVCAMIHPFTEVVPIHSCQKRRRENNGKEESCQEIGREQAPDQE